MSAIEDLAKRKVELQATLTAVAQSNIYGKTVEELTALELHRIAASKELHEVETKIENYIRKAVEA